MKTMQFEVGDRVICRRAMSGNPLVVDKYGTVVCKQHGDVGVVFDCDMRGHDLGGHLTGKQSNRGYWVSPGYLELAVEPEADPVYVPYDSIF